MNTATTTNAISEFQKLHESGCFVIPNPWDAGSAKCLQHLGFKALATTSAGLAFARGLPDSVKVLSLDMVLDNISDIVKATELPVNADFQHGYADQPNELTVNVTRCVETGAAGLSIEDATGDESHPLYEFELAVERIRAARAAINATGRGVVLTARCEAWLVGDSDAFKTSLERLVAYSNAGADCLFAPGVTKPEEIKAIVEAVAPKPVNILVSSAVPGLTVSTLSGLGVRRISVGSALSRVAFGAFLNAARSLANDGTFDSFSNIAQFAELNSIFAEQ